MKCPRGRTNDIHFYSLGHMQFKYLMEERNMCPPPIPHSQTDVAAPQPAMQPIYHRYCLTITGSGKTALKKSHLFGEIKQIFMARHIPSPRSGQKTMDEREQAGK